jgi:uncharacterized membrane protein
MAFGRDWLLDFGGLMRRRRFFTLLGAAAVAWPLLQSGQAMASCGDYVAGARTGAQILANPITEADQVHDPAMLDKYRNACIVAWKGGTRGAAGRAEDEARCRSIPGARVLEFLPDAGSNFNTCVFAPSDDTHNPGENSDDHIPPPGRDRGPPIPSHPPAPPQTSAPPTGYGTLRLCNRTGIPRISVAIHHFDTSRDAYVTEGWWIINSEACKSFTYSFGKYSTLDFGYHAYGGGLTWWNTNRADKNFCIVQPQQFTLYNSQCASSELLVGFKIFNLKKGDVMEKDITK